jgi:glucokinase-like ROK family protein
MDLLEATPATFLTSSTGSPENFVRQKNKVAVLDLLRKSSTGISRAAIAETLDLSRSTISAIIDDLLERGLVLEQGAGASRGGRRPLVLKIHPDIGRVVGVDIGASHLRALVADLDGVVLAAMEEPLRIDYGPEECLRRVYSLVQRLLDQAACGLQHVTAISVGVPGPVVARLGIVSAPPIMPGWDAFPIRQRLEQHWRKPITLENDADLAAVGEWTFGIGRGAANLAYIKIGTGIGCGLLLDGKLYRGVLGTAGEIGHVTISDDGPPCTCGNYGCLEAMAGGRAIAQRALLAVKAGQPTRLARLAAVGELTTRDVALAAREGDAVCQQLLADAGRHIGSALASLVNLLNPGLVIVGGGVAQAGPSLLDPLKQAMDEHTMRSSRQAVRVVVAELGPRAVAQGAVAQALTQTFAQYA